MAHAASAAGETDPWWAVAATSVARTLVDCAREWVPTDGVVAIDSALNQGKVTRDALLKAVLAGSHRAGIARAARAVSLSDGRAESPLETRGRLAMLRSGLPRPELQVEIYDDAGTLVGRVDGWYEDAAVAVEFDGQVKYTDPRYASAPGKVLWDEKRREDALRALGVRFRDRGADRRPAGRSLHRIPSLSLVRTAEPGGASDAA